MKTFNQFITEGLSKEDKDRAQYYGKKAFKNSFPNDPNSDTTFRYTFLNRFSDRDQNTLKKEFSKGYDIAKSEAEGASERASSKYKEYHATQKLIRDQKRKQDEYDKKDAERFEKSPYYTKKVTMDMEDVPCDRCGGGGYIQQYRHNKMGECFKCKTKGTVKKRVKKVEWVFDKKKWKKDNPNSEWWEEMFA